MVLANATKVISVKIALNNLEFRYLVIELETFFQRNFFVKVLNSGQKN